MSVDTARPHEPDDSRLYADHVKIYPAAVQGTFRRIKWAILVAGLGVYYFLPFLRWTRAPGQPDQAILIDLPGRRFYFFFVEIWPQEVYYLTGLMILAAFVLFLLNAVAGRVWCGYLCPQTVWTDLFFAVERFVQGDRRTQMRRDKGPWSFDRLWRKAATHFLWVMIAWWTGGAWVLYFADAPTLVRELVTFQASFIAYMWIGILTGTTYLLAGFAREQVCLYMCPWPRIQAALTDEWALNVSYRVDRGEPRGSLKSNDRLRAEGAPAGDCIDCGQCVAVCPTGVDIRQGLQMGCIQCGLCIDACDTVMTKIGREPRLIAYDTDINIERRDRGEGPIFRFVRPRTLVYVGLIAATVAVMAVQLSTRATLGLNVLHDRNPLYVANSDGSIRNGYTVRLLNKHAEVRRFELTIVGLPAGAKIDSNSAEAHAVGTDRLALTVDADQTREIRVLVTVPAAAAPAASTNLAFTLTDAAGEAAVAKDYFKAP
ncbi:cytochrome c oxidase accessory protein CcoG [Siculibacillus lacustris]|uniref:Cytochrome c oxidase accessory protein CcoG n=1 Tax=Siculibacillus lacustris TaxID=1549641 RepID=A0A4Q9VNZ3_9HYPH|nr:cytochrome c oxidase accessory protein CcoG [Siculibacillus lacustris]TBW37180.1 cytochrome c oxidase accessory protein CcoG [Siculibacillus lacustris]